MSKKRIEELLTTLSTEVKVNEINSKFLAFVPKRPTSPEKIRPSRIFLPIMLCLFLAVILCSLILFTINKPIFKSEDVNPITETKKMMTYQVISSLSLINEVSDTNQLADNLIQNEISQYLELAEYYLFKDDVKIESVVSDDINYANKYSISFRNQIYFYFNEKAEIESANIDLVSSKVEGYVVIDNIKYLVSGFKEIIGRQIKTSIKTYYSATDFIEVKQDIRLSPNKYDFSYYKNENIVKKISLKIKENVLSYEALIVEEDKSFSFTLDNEKIVVKVDMPNLYNGKVIIYEEKGEYVYIIK